MRQAAQVKGGFYPAPPEAVDLALQRLRPPGDGTLHVLDPCAGEGEALVQLCEGLDVPLENRWAIELSDARAPVVHEKPIGNVLGPCAMQHAQITAASFGLIWCNPPFDDEIGGGDRVEFQFLRECTRFLKVGGVMVLVMPERVARRNKELQKFFVTSYKQVTTCPFPAVVRQYDETMIFGVKRPKRAASGEGSSGEQGCVYTVRPSKRPQRFRKAVLTEDELTGVLSASRLRRELLTPPAEQAPIRPPLALNAGHTAMLMAAGHIGGVIRKPDHEPHVVRGTVKKEKYLDRVEENTDAKGVTKTITFYSEKITPVVRVARQSGEIVTLSNSNEQENQDDARCD